MKKNIKKYIKFKYIEFNYIEFKYIEFNYIEFKKLFSISMIFCEVFPSPNHL